MCFVLHPSFLFSLSFSDSAPPDVLAAAIEQAMTDEQALAQTFMLAWVGEEPSPLIMDWIRTRNIGGVKIFGWNTDDTMQLAQTVGVLQNASLSGPFNIPLLMATDQEGGWIRHVKGNTSETPGNMAIGASGYPRDAYLSGYYIGRELAALGINMNFAPTVDLFTNRDSIVIGPRAFGSDPVMTGIMGAAFSRGLLASGVIPTAKHYPGHGDTELDSHGVLPLIDVSFETLWERELVPYRMLVREGIPAVMSGHLAFPRTPGGRAPASLSFWFMTDLLRNQMGFNGVIVTDDLMMVGATVWTGSVSGAARQALLAGNDIVMFSQTPSLFDPVWNSLLASMRNDPAFRQRVRDAARRVLALKLEYLRGDEKVPYVPDLQKVQAGLPDPEGSAFFVNLAARSVTIVEIPGAHQTGGNAPGVFPLRPENAGRVLLAGQYGDFFRAGRAAFPSAVSFRYSGPENTAELLSLARNVDTVIFCLSDAAGLRLLRSLEPLGKRVIVLSILSPRYVESVPWVSGAVAVYSYSTESFAAGFSAITGRINARGILPYNIHE